MKKVFNLIVCDESGSMCVIEKQALVGLNETLETVRKMQQLHPDVEQHVTLQTFDSGHKRFLYDNVLAADAHPLSPKDYNPGGGTPLYDAVGLAISKLNAQTTVDDHVLVTIITDGEENCSEEYNLMMMKTLIEKLKKQNWTFTLIGTDNLDVEGMAGSLSIDNHLVFEESEEGTAEMFRQERHSRACYNDCVASEKAMPKGAYFKKK
jgi:uncharacterized protein YegL